MGSGSKGYRATADQVVHRRVDADWSAGWPAARFGVACVGRGSGLADIFISYARGDRTSVARLAGALEQAGWWVWWDQRFEGGAAFARVIQEELGLARVVIVAWSRESIESDCVRDEAAVARDAGKLLPVSLDGTPPPTCCDDHRGHGVHSR